MASLRSMCEKILDTLDKEGPYWVAEKSMNALGRKAESAKRSIESQTKGSMRKASSAMFDVVFVNGCDYSVPHPVRYRVDHQIEQLDAAGFTCLKVEANEVTDDLLRHGRIFVIFRCPYTDAIGSLIAGAKALNKTVLYDIDDLVIDTRYTDEIPLVKAMGPSERAAYDDGVKRMGKTLSLCDGAITTTEALAEELRNYVPKVYINRNCASDAMLRASDEAIFRRDVLPFLGEAQTPAHYRKIQKTWQELASCEDVVIGYFSGSYTHNVDFEMVLPVLTSLMDAHLNVKLMVVGDLALPDALASYGDRVVSTPFSSWTKLPLFMAMCDICIAPCQDTLFNRAKSENKWVEAALVKVPTVASDIGAFSTSVKSGETGFLCNSESQWHKALESLICSPELRRKIGANAREFCLKHRVTIYNTLNIRRIIDEALTPNVGFVMPNMNVSGGVLVILKHACILQDHGRDVAFLSVKDDSKWVDFEGHRFPVVDRRVTSGKIDACSVYCWFDELVATLWDTLDFVRRYPRTKRMLYFVQNYETDFFVPGNPLRINAEATYQAVPDVEYITISKWCLDWLEKDYGIRAKFAPNGLDVDRFYFEERDFSEGKVRILIEGDCGSEYKNVDEAFDITNRLDPNKFEVWYMCYTGKTKPHYRIDRNLGCVAPEKVPNVYRQCHILLKTSKLESFSYPPLEMMSTGGFVVARPNEGNIEFLVDGENCLLYPPGDIEEALVRLNVLAEDEGIRMALSAGGAKTAQERDWRKIENDILRLYE